MGFKLMPIKKMVAPFRWWSRRTCGILLLIFCISALLMLIVMNNDNAIGPEQSMEMMGTDFSRKQRHHFEIRFKNMRLKYRMAFANACPQNAALIIMSMSRRDSFEKRAGIRSTWMKGAVPGEVIRFLIADPLAREAKGVQQKLEQEQKKHGDLVFLHGFNDTYAHIHLKWYGAIQWQQSFCADAKWVVKADDDAVVHLRRLAHWTEKKFRRIAQQNPLIYFGHVYYSRGPIREKSSKWYASVDMYPGDNYPPFMQGTVYLATRATLRAILLHSAEVAGFYLDDVVFTGLLAELANVTRSDQKMHFVFSNSFQQENGGCVDGVPTAISMWGANGIGDYGNMYEKLKSVNCKKA